MGSGAKGPKVLLQGAADPWVAQAAGVVREQIRRDQRRVQHPLRALLGYFADHFARGKLTVTHAMLACGFRDHTLPLRFHREIGIPPGAYIEDCQMELAARLLESPWSGSIGDLGDLLGFANLPAFSRAFERWSGQRPSVYRQKVAELRERGQVLPDAEILRRRRLADLENGSATPELRAEITQWVKALHPGLAAGYAAVDPTLAAAEPALAERVWRTLRELPPAELRKGMGYAAVFTSPAFFEHLLQMSRVEGRADRQRGIVVAELALESLMPLAWHLGARDLGHLQARAWAALGNARALAWELDLAEQDFLEAERLLEVFEPVPAAILAEERYLKSCLRSSQRRWSESLELVCEAEILACETGSADLKAQILMQRGGVYLALDQPEKAIVDFESSAAVLPENADLYPHFVALANLATASASIGRHAEASAALREARTLPLPGHGQRLDHLDWLDALLTMAMGDDASAAARLAAVCRGFRERGEAGHLAIASLDLATVLLRQGRAEEMPAVLEEVFSLTSILKMDAETLAASRLLKAALEEESSRIAQALRQFRERLARSHKAPTVLASEGGR